MSGRWGSVFSGAIAGLESRLDTILAEDDQASAKSRATEAKAKQDATEKTAVEKGRLQVDQAPSRASSQSRPNSRLQDRLAKAVNKDRPRSESRTSSELPSRPESPALRSPGIFSEVGRSSIDSKLSEPITETTTGAKADASKEEEVPRLSSESIPPVSNPPVVSEQPMSIQLPEIKTSQTSIRQSIESPRSYPSLDLSASTDLDIPSAPRSPAVVEAELGSLQKSHEQTLSEHREEMNSHLERIDALQSKLTYLSQQLASQAKAAASEAKEPQEKKLAEKDAQIAALMEEGQNLSKTEMKHLTTIKKMRSKALENDKEIINLKQRLSKAEKNIREATDRAKRAETAEKASQEKLKIVAKIEKDIEMIRAEREEANLTITELRRQLSEALSKAEYAEKRVQTGALEAEKRTTTSLREDIENVKIEKKLAEDRVKRELQEVREEAKRNEERAKVAELELRGEITNLETKLELLRSRSEEVSSSATGDSQAKLLRQIETLQTQYALASENWQGIEGTLTSRVAALEKERDETAKRESDVRRKAREVNSKARRFEDELESLKEESQTLEEDLLEQRTQTQKLQTKLAQTEATAVEARENLVREKKIWEADLQQRLEEEKSKWHMELQHHTHSNYLRADSPSTSNRKHSPDILALHNRRSLVRSTSSEVPLSPMDRLLDDRARPTSSRKSTNPKGTPEIGTPVRQDSIPSSLSAANGASATPSIHTIDVDEAFENTSSPHRTINDMISVSTVGAGPSVQLVERMSAAVRRLESEKATSKEEMARIVAQRDEAREEVVALMREVEDKRAQDEKVGCLEKDLKEVDQRYQTTLEMFGEKSERVEELTADVADLKKIIRDLVEKTVK